jgi:DNA-directed RNA polymerase specialized sigma24 family protein
VLGDAGRNVVATFDAFLLVAFQPVDQRSNHLGGVRHTVLTYLPARPRLMDVSAAPGPQPLDDDHLLAAHYLPVMRLCLSRLHDPADAEDATQEVFRRAVQHAARLRDDPLPWLITVAKNVCHDELRRRRSQLAPLEPEDDVPAGLRDDTTPEGVVVGRMSAVELLGRLTPGERRAVAARMSGGAADAVTSTTRVLLMRARQKLRQYIEESQSAMGTATVYGSEVMHRARQRVFGRVLLGQGRAGLLLPAVVIATVALTPATSAPAIPGPGVDVPQVPLRLAYSSPPRDAGGESTQKQVPNAVAKLSPSLAVATPGADMATLPPPVGPKLDLQDHQATDVATWDVQPSPTYSSDHSVLMTGTNEACGGGVAACQQLYRSKDGGSTWDFVPSTGPHGYYVVVLPEAGYAAGRYYVFDLTGVQRTLDDGRTFTSILPLAMGYPLAAPKASGFDLIVGSASTLWAIRPNGAVEVLSVFPGYEAAGTPVMLPTATGYEILQPVSSNMATAVSQSLKLLRCTPTCGAPVDLYTYTSQASLAPSPNIAVDHTIVGYGRAGGVAVSHDDGQTFVPARDPGAVELADVAGPAVSRLAAVVSGIGVLEYSDDQGMTWQAAHIRVPHLTQARNLRVLRPGRLIASMMRLDDPAHYVFVCSGDAATWSLCTPDAG